MLKKHLFKFKPSGKAREGFVFSDHAVTGDKNPDGIFVKRLSYGTGSVLISDSLSNLRLRGRFAWEDF